MFPLLTDPTLEICYDDLTHMPEIRRHLMTSGEYAREHDITCSMHPDQFNVLTSYSPTVVDKTIVELNHQSDVLDMMGYSPDYGSPMCLHLNKSPDLKKESVSEYVGRFLDGLSRCNAGVQQRLVLENEDKAAWNCVTLYENFSSHVPLVFDNLHHVCNPSGDEFENAKLFKETWRGHTPVFHWSESMPDSTNKRSHANYATHLPPVVFDNLDATWEVELKSKDNAIHHILTSFFAN
jgi:UV DNA damage endonuclease